MMLVAYKSEEVASLRRVPEVWGNGAYTDMPNRRKTMFQCYNAVETVQICGC
jgi:hypothetical protein